MNYGSPVEYDESEFFGSEAGRRVNQEFVLDHLNDEVSSRLYFYQRNTSLFRPLHFFKKNNKESGRLSRRVAGLSFAETVVEDKSSFLFTNLHLLKLGGLVHSRYYLYIGRRSGYFKDSPIKAPFIYTTLAAMRALFSDLSPNYRARRPAYVSAAHAL
jgi:hypothetical protein